MSIHHTNWRIMAVHRFLCAAITYVDHLTLSIKQTRIAFRRFRLERNKNGLLVRSVKATFNRILNDFGTLWANKRAGKKWCSMKSRWSLARFWPKWIMCTRLSPVEFQFQERESSSSTINESIVGRKCRRSFHARWWIFWWSLIAGHHLHEFCNTKINKISFRATM